MKESLSERVFHRLLTLFPRDFRRRFGDDMRAVFRDQLRAEAARGGLAPARLWLHMVPRFVAAAACEHRDALFERSTLVPNPLPLRTRRDGMLSTCARDVRFAFRMLRKSPVFTVVAVLVISLGTGAVTTIYSALNALVLRPLPGTHEGDRIVGFEMFRKEGDRQMTGARTLYQQIRARTRTLEDVAAWNRFSMTLSSGGEGIAVSGTVVSGNYFSVLGVRPEKGRFFLPVEDSTPLTHPVMVLSHGFWTRALGGDPAIVGKVLMLNRRSFTVVGVAGPEFMGAMPIVPGDVYVPFMMQEALRPVPDVTRAVWVRPFGRLKQGVTPAAAERELSALVRAIADDPAERPEDRQWSGIRVSLLRAVPEDARTGFLGFIGVLLGAAGLVMLIASVNVASMLSARAVGRRREMALRTALGARRLTLVRQLLTESLLLFGLGAAGGLVIASLTTSALEQMRLPFDRSPVLEISPDPRALVVALTVALLTGLVFGLSPALQASRKDVTSRLRDESAGGGTKRSWMANALIAGQLAASLVLLVSAGLFIRALDRGSRVDPGFDATGVSTMQLNPESWGYDEAKARAFYQTVRENVDGLPGVTAVSYSGFIPMSMSGTGGNIVIDGRDDPARGERPAGVPIRQMNVGAEYFALMKIPMRSGRAIEFMDDERAPLVAVVNETLARRYWPDGDAVGRTFSYGTRRFAVVGVARDVKYDQLVEDTPPVVYFPMAQEWVTSQVLLVRTTSAPESMARALQEAVLAIDPALPRPTVTTLREANRVGLLPQRVAAVATGLLGGVGLLMATVGLYGIIAYSVGRRTREIGVRVALGAQRSQVLGMVVREGMLLTAVGVVIGLAAAVALTPLLARFLLDVDPMDALTFVGMATLFIGVTALASYLPARRAATTDPMRALRTD